MRIISIREAAVARVFTIAYAIFGLAGFLIYTAGSAEYVIVPLGIVTPLFHLNVTFDLPRSTDLLSNVFYCLITVLSYAASGLVSGIAAAFCFNAIAKWTGGIDAKYFYASSDEGAIEPIASHPL
jgi:hypothetical protein